MDCCHPISHTIGISGLLTLGVAGSLHCAGMCGPLSALLSGPTTSTSALWRYHLGRLISYSALGFGVGLIKQTFFSPSPWWGLAIIIPLFVYASGMTIPLPARLTTFQMRLLANLHRIPVGRRAHIVGLCTPLLPCGLLYGALASVTAAPSPFVAALWMAVFAAGTTPLLWIIQHGLRRWQRTPTSRSWTIFSRILAATSAAILGWMLVF